MLLCIQKHWTYLQNFILLFFNDIWIVTNCNSANKQVRCFYSLQLLSLSLRIECLSIGEKVDLVYRCVVFSLTVENTPIPPRQWSKFRSNKHVHDISFAIDSKVVSLLVYHEKLIYQIVLLIISHLPKENDEEKLSL